jgi:hypothetical protein
MNILFVVPYVPDRIRPRPYNLIRALRSRGHTLTLVTLWTSGWEREAVEALRQEGFEVHAVRLSPGRSMWNSLRALPTRTPLQAVYCWHPQVPKVLSDLLSGRGGRPPFDVIHVEHLRGALYGLWLKRWMAEQGLKVPVLWDSVDCISLLFKHAARDSRSAFGRWIGHIEIGRTEAFEAHAPFLRRRDRHQRGRRGAPRLTATERSYADHRSHQWWISIIVLRTVRRVPQPVG